MAQPPVILLAFANDRRRGTDNRAHLAALPTELRQIRDALHEAEQAGACAVEALPDATAEDIVRAFQSPRLRDRIAVLHFAGHASASALLLETRSGGVAALAGKSLATFLGTQPALTLVFVNGCDSLKLAEPLLRQGVGAVIGATAPELEDAWAAHFASVFYRALAAGRSLAQAFKEAQTAPRGQPLPEHADGRKRGIGGLDDADAPEPPWQLSYQPGSEERLQAWRLQDLDPLRHLPLPKDLVLPDKPFELGLLQGYDRDHAPAFFGRGAPIRDLYAQLTDDNTQPIVLFHGQSGVGKSSLMAAGLLPRLEHLAVFAVPVPYLRRPPQTGLVAALIQAIGPGATLAEAWREREQRDGKPLLVVLDQVDELLQTPAGRDSWQSLLLALAPLFPSSAQWPRGKLLLGLRKEWLSDIKQDLRDSRLPHGETDLLKRLEKADLLAIFRDLRRNYRHLQWEPENLPETIAADLLKDPDSPVAPTLQILMSQLWQEATQQDLHAPRFTGAQYEKLRRQGLHLADFLDRKLAELSREHPSWSRTGLALDVLNAHTTDLDFAAERSEPELRQRFPRQSRQLPPLLAYCKDRALLTEAAQQGDGKPRATRLVHDTLAPLVRRKWREMKQRQELRKERQRTLVAWVMAGALFVAVGAVGWFWQEVNRYSKNSEQAFLLTSNFLVITSGILIDKIHTLVREDDITPILAQYSELLEKASGLAEEKREDPAYQHNLGMLHMNYAGLIFAAQPSNKEAKAHYDIAISIFERLPTENQNQHAFEQTLEEAYDRLAYYLQKSPNGNQQESFENYKKALDAHLKMPSHSNGYAEGLAKRYGQLAWSALLLKRFEAAKEYAEQGLKLDQKKAWIRLNLAHALLYLGKTDEAWAHYQHDTKSCGNLLVDFQQLRGAGLDPAPMAAIIHKLPELGCQIVPGQSDSHSF